MTKTVKLSTLPETRKISSLNDTDRMPIHQSGRQQAGFAEYGDIVSDIANYTKSSFGIKFYSSYTVNETTYTSATFSDYDTVSFSVPEAGALFVLITIYGQTTSNNSSGTHSLDAKWSVGGNPYSISPLILNFNPNDPDTRNFAHAQTAALSFTHYLTASTTFHGALAFRRTTTASGSAKVYNTRINGIYVPGAVTASW